MKCHKNEAGEKWFLNDRNEKWGTKRWKKERLDISSRSAHTNPGVVQSLTSAFSTCHQKSTDQHWFITPRHPAKSQDLLTLHLLLHCCRCCQYSRLWRQTSFHRKLVPSLLGMVGVNAPLLATNSSVMSFWARRRRTSRVGRTNTFKRHSRSSSFVCEMAVHNSIVFAPTLPL